MNGMPTSRHPNQLREALRLHQGLGLVQRLWRWREPEGDKPDIALQQGHQPGAGFAIGDAVHALGKDPEVQAQGTGAHAPVRRQLKPMI